METMPGERTASSPPPGGSDRSTGPGAPVARASGLGASALRVGAFVRKELVGVLRQPALVLTLVLGPFLILLLFGSGILAGSPPVPTVVVAPEGSAVAEQARRFAENNDTPIAIEEITADLDAALRRLRGGDVHLVVTFPTDIEAALSEGRRPAIVFYHDYLDPIEAQALVATMSAAVDQINAQVAQTLVQQAQQDAGDLETRVQAANQRLAGVIAAVERGDADEAQQQLTALRGEVAGLDPEAVAGAVAPEAQDAQDSGQEAVADLAEQVDELAERARDADAVPGGDQAAQSLDRLATDLQALEGRLAEFTSLPPELFVSPFRGVADRVVDAVDLTDFYAPAVLVLLLQHLAVTFLGLSVVRDTELGTIELFRVAPLSAAEIIAGKCLAYLLLTGTVAVVLTGLLMVGLDVPLRGSPWLLAGCALVLLLASTGLGFLLALLAGNATQAVQFAMLLLLSNVFFTGFLVGLERFSQPVRSLPWLLPATYGVRLFRDVMLRGTGPPPVLLAVLAAMAAGLLGLSWLLLRRRLLRA